MFFWLNFGKGKYNGRKNYGMCRENLGHSFFREGYQSNKIEVKY
jgi:hypothetical protein